MSDKRYFFVVGPSFIEDGDHQAPVALYGEPIEKFDVNHQVGQFGFEKGNAGHMPGDYDGEYQHFCEFVCESDEASEYYLWDDAEEAWWRMKRADWSTSEGPEAPFWQAIGPDGKLAGNPVLRTEVP